MGLSQAQYHGTESNKEIIGLDAVTGLLQASEKFDLYAHILPLDKFSNLEYEDLSGIGQQGRGVGSQEICIG